MSSQPAPFHFIAGIKVDPGPIPDLKPPKKELSAELPEQGVMAAVILLAFAALFLGRRFHRPKVVPPLPPEHPASAIRRALSEIVPNDPPPATAAKIAQAFRDYLRASFGLGEEELTTLELSDRFEAHRLANEETAGKVRQFLRDCNSVQFAPSSDTSLVSLVERAWPLIDELERQRTPPVYTPPPLPVAT